MPHSTETKAAALAQLAAGETLGHVSRALGVPKSTIVRWRDEHMPDRAAQEKKAEIGERVYALLEDYIETLRVQVRETRDPVWIKRQSADHLAILHGVLSDKAVRLLAAFRPQEANDGDYEA